MNTISGRQKLKRLVVNSVLMSLLWSCVGVCNGAASFVPNKQQQTPQRLSDAQLKAILADCLKKDEDLDYLTKKVAALDKLSRQNQELVAALDSQVTAQERTIAALKGAIAAGQKIEGVDEKLLKSFEDSLKDAKGEISRLTRSRNFWRKVASFGLVTVAVVAGALGYIAGSK